MLNITLNFTKNFIILILWSVLIVASLFWNIYDHKRHILELAAISARENFNKDQAFRQWGALHGGVYVPINKRTPPNPALAHIPNRDIESKDGLKLTLMNPAYMLRQMMQEYDELYGIKGKITGRVLLNKINKADSWELKALDKFDEGIKEIKELSYIDGKPYLRLMRPMIMKHSCMKCHGHLGFKIGDIRGGVGVAIPLASYLEKGRWSIILFWISHGIILVLGVVAIYIFNKYKRERHIEIENKSIMEQEILQAETANLAKSEFLSRMSHELRTPLNAILGFAQMLDINNSTFSKKQKGNVKEILDAGDHLLTLINEVLNLSYIESGKLDINIEEVNLNDVLNKCFDIIKPELEKNNIDIINEFKGEQFYIKADEFRLKQILLNILSNAIKYNKDNGTITIKYKLVNNNYLRICIIDTGVGLSETEISRLFTPFERLDNRNNVEGTGIGLTITKKLTELMSGKIGTESVLGSGSTFWLEFELKNTEVIVT